MPFGAGSLGRELEACPPSRVSSVREQRLLQVVRPHSHPPWTVGCAVDSIQHAVVVVCAHEQQLFALWATDAKLALTGPCWRNALLFANLQVCRERGGITHRDFELLLGLLRCHGPARVRECKRLADSCVRVIRPPALLTGCRGTGRSLSNAVLLPYHREVTIESEEWRRWTDLEGFEPHSPSVQWLWEYDLSPGGPQCAYACTCFRRVPMRGD